ncbi:MAG: hypothetical protein KAX55_02320, partial [Propionivibrio sp.]|nr:hypothetical protein [Propionivibrio sp.]
LYKDHLGSIVATADGTGASTAIYSYGPYGEPNVLTGQRFRYTGQQLIGGLGLYYYKARFYSPTLGRFLQTDPIGTADDLNLYAYVGNDPVNLTDPTGQWALAGAGWGALTGGVSGAITGFAQNRYQGAFIGAVTGVAAGGVVGFAAPHLAAKAGSSAGALAVTAIGGGIGSVGQQWLAMGVYAAVDPRQVIKFSIPTALGAAAAVPGAAGLAKALPAFGNAVVQATAGIFGKSLPAVAPKVTNGGKALSAIYEGTAGAVGELLGGYSKPQPPTSSAPSGTSASGR